MKISINIQPDIPETEVLIKCQEQTSEVHKIVSTLESMHDTLLCSKENTLYNLEVKKILYIEAVNRKTFIYTDEEIYETKRRLYELEKYLNNGSFFRASKAFLINLMRVQSLKPELGARLLLTMKNGENIIVSRQYAKNIKNALEVL